VLVDKPAGMTSHDVVQRVRHALGARAAGHTGTLDPFATGLLVVLVGRATRLARFLEGQPKTYLATARLGIRTATDDLTGPATGTPEPTDAITELQVRDALHRFHGTQLQRPPQFSAKRVGGERSYRKARRGEAVELVDVSVTVHQIDLIEYRPPEVRFRAVVSAGTYIRSMARDLGDRLGTGAHLTALRREAIGSFQVGEAVPLEQLTAAALIPARVLLAHLPSVDLDDSARRDVAHGRAVVDGGEAGKWGSGEAVALLRDGQLVAVAKAEDGWLRPTVVLDTPE
jgi:tRNA pseudouridine55 synthase